jgi:aryl-alcohol dehydrogenase-like predicted oxidoreductase
MRYRRLGQSGCKVSVLSFGSWLTVGSSIDQPTTDALVRTAFENGVNLFDTADIYSRGEAEEALGKALAPLRRQDFVLSTKCFWPMSENVNDRGLSRKHLFESVHNSLRRLKTDYLDLMLCHRFDPETEVDELVCAMTDLIRQGKVLYWGVSVWSGTQIAHACRVADVRNGYRPIANQPPYNLLERGVELEVVPECAKLGISQIVFSPLCQGLLTGKYSGGAVPPDSRAADDKRNGFLKPKMTPDALARAARMAEIARKAGLSPSVAALAWVVGRPGIASAIVGATRPEQLLENLKAADLELPAAVSAALDEISPAT